MISPLPWQVSFQDCGNATSLYYYKVTITNNISHLIMLAILLALEPLTVKLSIQTI